MSRDIYETYERAIAVATDGGNAPGRVLKDIAAAFELGDDAISVLARNALWRRIGLVKTEIAVDGPRFDVHCLYQRAARGIEAWVMPVYAVPAFGSREAEMEDLIAFGASGAQAGKVWRHVCAIDAIGLPFEAAQRVLTVFTQPKLWLQHWLDACRDNLGWLSAVETGPEAFATLVLDPKKINWRTHSIEPLLTASFDEIRFADSPALREAVAREQKLPELKFPRLRAIKAKPEPETADGTPPAAA